MTSLTTIFPKKRRLIRGSASYWKERRRLVIRNLQKAGYIAEVGPAGQVLWRQHVGPEEAWSWWRRAERPPRLWLLTLLISVLLALLVWQLQPGERKVYFLVLVAPPLLHAVVGFVRYIRR
jgi:hypothetical protein